MANNFPNTISVDQGRDLQFSLIWLDADRQPMDLTGYTAIFAIAENYGLTPVVSITDSSGISIEALTGTVNVEVAGSLTDALTKSVYVAELVLTSGLGVETSLLKGSLKASSKVVP